MANFETWVDVDPDDYWREMSRREKNEMIGIAVEAASEDDNLKDTLIDSIKEHFEPGDRIIISATPESSYDQLAFEKSLQALQRSYYSLSQDKIDQINEIAKIYK